MGYFGVSWLEDGAKFNVVVTKKSKKQKPNPQPTQGSQPQKWKRSNMQTDLVFI